MARRTWTDVDGSDQINVYPSTFAAFQDELEPTVFYDQGPIGSRPTATPGSPSQQVGDLYLVTDGPVPILYRNAATKWVSLTQLSFSARPSSDTSLAEGSPSKVVLGTESWDDGGWYTPATSRFLPTIAGVYHLGGRMRLMDPLDQGDGLYLFLYKNGVAVCNLDIRTAAAAEPELVGANGTTLVQANGTSDYFELFAQHQNSVSRRYQATATEFFGHLVRPA